MNLHPFLYSTIFVAINYVVMIGLYNWIKITGKDKTSQTVDPEPEKADVPQKQDLNPENIMEWEFEYARITASEAMRDRHTMINFYLLFIGVIATLLIGYFEKMPNPDKVTGALILWSICGVSWFYFLILIRLRQAWHDSLSTMNEIKEFYIDHAKNISPDIFSKAFRWRKKSIPPVDKPWSVFFYSTMLIAFLSTISFLAGSALLAFQNFPVVDNPGLLKLTILGLIFFVLHADLYFRYLGKGV